MRGGKTNETVNKALRDLVRYTWQKKSKPLLANKLSVLLVPIA